MVLGIGKRFEAETLEVLSQKLKRDRYSIDRVNLEQTKRTIAKIRTVVVWGEHRLTQNEKMKKMFKPPYFGNPFIRVRDIENVQIKIIYHHDKGV